MLATTDPQKLPETILSRCQRYNFSRISVRDTLARLQEVLKGEGVTVDEDALLIVARRAGGALRDALGFLDQVLATGADPIDVATVTDTLGLVGSDLYGELLASFVERDPAKALSVVSDVHRAGHDLEFFVQGLLDMLRNVLVVKTVPKPETVVDVTEEERAHLRETAAQLELGDLLRMIRMTVELVDQIRQSDYPWILVEVAVVELASLDRVTDLTTLLKALERGVDSLPRSDGALGGGDSTTSAASKPASRSAGTKKTHRDRGLCSRRRHPRRPRRPPRRTRTPSRGRPRTRR